AKENLIVDDGSDDGTTEILKNINDKDLKIIFHPKNYGKGTAIKTGLKNITGDLIIVQDGDLEYEPSEYIKLLHPILNNEAEIVYGSRILGSKNRSYNRYYWGGRFLSSLTNMLYGSHLTDEPTCYKLFKKKVIDSINLECKGFEFCPEITSKALRIGYKIIEVPISYNPRSMAEGKKIRWYDGLYAIYILIKNRFTPISKIYKARI
ncbi:MAG: glycosyltransferase family 2 protein, partial [Candidatus Hydrogenedentota bacterium]